MSEDVHKMNPFRFKLHEIIYESDTPAGKFFDVVLLILIMGSVITVMLESVETWRLDYGQLLHDLEWGFTIVFTLEYLLRLYCVQKPWKYATSFFGIVDLLAIIPTYLTYFFIGTQSLVVIRSLRLLRVFRIFKIGTYLTQGTMILEAIRSSRNKIFLFLYFVILMVLIIGSAMYVVEGAVNEQFDSIPTSIYWAIVTLTTVGYGDITPVTDLGKFMSAVVMILGYAVIAVPTGIVSASMIRGESKVSGQACPHCSLEGHDRDAVYCKYCGDPLYLNDEVEQTR